MPAWCGRLAGSIGGLTVADIPFPDERTAYQEGTTRKSERLGGLLNFYRSAAA